ncbi:PLP-dependent cysteine synthase family protein [Haloarchaeobius sp. DFWS5]|uniref:PLP-dependent cysteine synthase family protein n=1 Tax=Haloarchaeobius sp. DFWS5 TaxID=3446114 RepID=UPI003EBF4B14
MELRVERPCPYPTDDPILQQIGNTPLVSYGGEDGPNLFCKLETENPTRSMKDRIAWGILSEAFDAGEYDTIVEGSSGNTGGSVAMVANRLGADCHITTPASTSVQKKGYMRAYGAVVHECPGVEEGDPEHYVEVAIRLAEEHDALFVDQYSNLANPEVHYNWTGPELWEQVGPDVTHFVCPMGTGGTISGCARAMKERAAEAGTDLTVVGVDAEDSNISNAFYGNPTGPYDTEVEGLGKGHELPTMWFDYVDEVRDVADDVAFDQARTAARDHGLLVGPSSGATLSVGLDITEENPDANVVTMVCDGGEQYFDTLW